MQRPLSRLVRVPEISEQGDTLPAMLLPLQSLGALPPLLLRLRQLKEAGGVARGPAPTGCHLE